MKRLNLFLPVFAALAVCGCSGPVSSETESVSVVTWNVQNLFDAVDDGGEYKEFRRSSGWNQELYEARLTRLCGAIRELDADIFVMEEIENRGVLYDISNRLADGSWNSRKNWNFAAFAKTPGAAAGCAVLSRFPLSDISAHSLDIRSEARSQPSMRPILQASVTVGKKTLVLLVNHWKSKSGGQEQTEKWRDWQESVLAGLFAELTESRQTAVLACGDFNRDISDFCGASDRAAEDGFGGAFGSDSDCAAENDSACGQPPCAANVRLRRAAVTGKGAEAYAEVYSPWPDFCGIPAKTGSYFYDGEWERIDHFFCAGALELTDFAPDVSGEWAGTGGVPARYKSYTGMGWSDHLPLRCRVTLW